MTWRRYVAALALLVGIVLSPLRAVATTIPMLIAYDTAVRTTATVQIATGPSLRSELDALRPELGASDEPDNGTKLRAADCFVARRAYDDALNLAEPRAPVDGAIYGAPAATTAAEAAPEAFTVADRVAGQLADSRLGPLAGKITPEALQDLASNPNALKFLDTASGHTNTVQLVEGRLLRITTAGDDASRIISVGPMQRNGLFNGIANGRFTPLIEDP